MNLDFERKKYAVLYDMYVKFQKTYYGNDNRDAMLSIGEFLLHGPFVVIDCSRQNESIKSATVDIRIEFECKENIPLNTTAYCLIIHDRMIEYNPLTVIRKIVYFFSSSLFLYHTLSYYNVKHIKKSTKRDSLLLTKHFVVSYI